MPATVIIPARFHSTRFPGKPLCPLQNKPLIQHVYERAQKAKRVRSIYVATDHQGIFEAVQGFGGNALMTSEAHESGTDRIAEALAFLRRTKGEGPDIVVNLQGDEPLIRPEMIDDVITLLDDTRASIGTLVKRITDPHELCSPNVVKAVFSEEGYALYFSRAAIPFYRDLFRDPHPIRRKSSKEEVAQKDECSYASLLPRFESGELLCFKHIGIYAYRSEVLEKFAALKPSRLEQIEKLEQLRALEHGWTIKVKETEFETIGVDTPMDLERVKSCLSTSL